MYARTINDDAERAVFDSMLNVVTSDEERVIREQLALETATMAIGIARNGLPVDAAAQEALARKSSSIAKLVAAAAAVREANKVEAPTTITIAAPDFSSTNVVQVRGPDRELATAIRGPSGETLLQAAPGLWRECIEQTDAETGAKFYQFLLEG